MTRFLDRDALGQLPVTGVGEPPCLDRHPWTGYGCQAGKGHAPPCRYYSARGWQVEWHPGGAAPSPAGVDDQTIPRPRN
jgi:hypothetical protein